MRTVQRLAGGVVALTATTLILFAAVKSTEPASSAVLDVLTGVLVCATAVWLTLLPVSKLSNRLDSAERERESVRAERDTLRGEREALREVGETLRTERDQANGALRQLRIEIEAAGEPRLPDEIRDRVIRLDDLPPWVMKRTFEKCELVGPGPAWIGPSQQIGCKLLGITANSFLTQNDMSSLPEGTVRFIDCRFINCELQSFVMAGTAAQIDRLRREFEEPAP